ncbi:Cytoplasmic membrane protein [Zostera marina]|uniref:Cytoplasmic membrane protein n=1 Tax=Zostera marina TaxID=29655 RepID=A0A0K9Q1T6_ZOSMR|nr:Cytoplasmic membrane protein [Zostera marina]
MQWIQKKIVDPLLQILRRGAEPKQLAFSAALGLTLGVFPICGITLVLCVLAIAVLGEYCHAPCMMLANFVATPFELCLVIPFLRFGEFICSSSHFPLNSDALIKVLTGHGTEDMLLSIFHALLGWVFAAPFLLAILFMVFLPCSKYLLERFGGPSYMFIEAADLSPLTEEF